MSRSTPRTASSSPPPLSVRLDRATYLALRQFGAHHGLTDAEIGRQAIQRLLDAASCEPPPGPKAPPSPAPMPATHTSNHNSRPDTSHD